MAPVPNWSNARSQMRSLSGEVVWETQTTCAIVHFGPKSAPHRRDFGPGRRSLLRECVNHGARPDFVQRMSQLLHPVAGGGLGNPDHLRHRPLRSETASHDCVAGTPAEPRFRTGKEEPTSRSPSVAGTVFFLMIRRPPRE